MRLVENFFSLNTDVCFTLQGCEFLFFIFFNLMCSNFPVDIIHKVKKTRTIPIKRMNILHKHKVKKTLTIKTTSRPKPTKKSSSTKMKSIVFWRTFCTEKKNFLSSNFQVQKNSIIKSDFLSKCMVDNVRIEFILFSFFFD